MSFMDHGNRHGNVTFEIYSGMDRIRAMSLTDHFQKSIGKTIGEVKQELGVAAPTFQTNGNLEDPVEIVDVYSRYTDTPSGERLYNVLIGGRF